MPRNTYIDPVKGPVRLTADAPDFPAFVDVILRRVAAQVDVSYEDLVADFAPLVRAPLALRQAPKRLP